MFGPVKCDEYAMLCTSPLTTYPPQEQEAKDRAHTQGHEVEGHAAMAALLSTLGQLDGFQAEDATELSQLTKEIGMCVCV